MNLSDYLLAHDKLDWSTMLADWDWILPPSFRVWMVNQFADLFIVQDDGSVWMLDTSAGSFSRIADSCEHFAEISGQEDLFSNWFIVDAVDDMVGAGNLLGDGQCFSYKLPPGLGGEYDLQNFIVTDLHVHLSLHGQIFRQIKDLPDGTSLTFKIN
ncbi:MAG: DUF1851 domain-containing protein [Verrucomicrobiae bacterium]|nr:DUF1851 domain-containing protein [Verrucomicrobiae bacterium]